MDIEKLIQAAEYCSKNGYCDPCPIGDRVECIANVTLDTGDAANMIIAMKSHYENLLIKQSEFNDRVNGQLIQDRWDERSKVIAEVKHLVENIYGDNIAVYELYEKLDSMEPDKVVKTETDKWAGISEEDRKRDLDSSCGP